MAQGAAKWRIYIRIYPVNGTRLYTDQRYNDRIFSGNIVLRELAGDSNWVYAYGLPDGIKYAWNKEVVSDSRTIVSVNTLNLVWKFRLCHF